VPLVPEITLRQTDDDPFALWERAGVEVPFWAFAWAGGQALARYVLDHPDVVAGRRVLDLASGSGLVAVAAALAGASSVTATDIDPLAVLAIGVNAEANGVTVTAFGPTLTVPYDSILRRDLRTILDFAPTLAPDDPRLVSATERLTAYHLQAVEAIGRPADLIGFHGRL